MQGEEAAERAKVILFPYMAFSEGSAKNIIIVNWIVTTRINISEKIIPWD